MGGESSAQAAGFRDRVIALYQTHRDGIYRFLVGHGLTPAVAQELTQDVFVDLFVALEKGTQMNSEQGWLYTVAGRAAVDYWRREPHPTQVDLESVTGLAGRLASAEPSPEVRVEHLERNRQVAARLAQLPRERRMCVQLRMQGLRYREISKILGISTSTAAEWIVAAIDYLRGES